MRTNFLDSVRILIKFFRRTEKWSIGDQKSQRKGRFEKASEKSLHENKFLKREKRKDDGLSIAHLCVDCLFTRVE